MFRKIFNEDVSNPVDSSNDFAVDTYLDIFKNVTETNDDDKCNFSEYFETESEMYGLNYPITPEEILQCMKNKRVIRHAGCDELVN